MKKIASLLLICCFAFSMSYAQDEKLSEDAALLFDNAELKLSNAEKNEIYQATGFAVAKNGTQFYLANNPKTAETPFDVTIFPLDLNDDGIEEIAIEFGNEIISGQAGKSTFLCVMDMEGHYRTNFGFPGTIVFLNLNPLTLPDILVRQSSFGYPIWRWNGDDYVKHKEMSSKELRKMQITYLADASKAYMAPKVRE